MDGEAVHLLGRQIGEMMEGDVLICRSFLHGREECGLQIRLLDHVRPLSIGFLVIVPASSEMDDC